MRSWVRVHPFGYLKRDAVYSETGLCSGKLKAFFFSLSLACHLDVKLLARRLLVVDCTHSIPNAVFTFFILLDLDVLGLHPVRTMSIKPIFFIN